MSDSASILRELTAICERAAAGDLEARVSPAPDSVEFAALGGAINHLLDICDAYVRESAAALDHCARGEFHRPILLRGLHGSYRHAAVTINRAAHKMSEDAAKIARFETERKAVARRVAETTDSVTSSAGDLRANATSIQEHVADSRRLAEDVAQATDLAAQNTNAVAAACQELSICTSEITRRTQESAGLTQSAVAEATRAGSAVTQLGDAARQIGTVVDVIDKIARQTNLLALNATIEAARAGEHGRSFAVVAGEVKSLSRETAEATKKIAGQIDAMQQATAKVGQVIGGVGESIHHIDASATAISTSVAEQARAVEEIAERIAQVSTSTESISTRMADVAIATENLDAITRDLKSSADQLATDAEGLQRETWALDAGEGNSTSRPVRRAA